MHYRLGERISADANSMVYVLTGMVVLVGRQLGEDRRTRTAFDFDSQLLLAARGVEVPPQLRRFNFRAA